MTQAQGDRITALTQSLLAIIIILGTLIGILMNSPNVALLLSMSVGVVGVYFGRQLEKASPTPPTDPKGGSTP